MARLKRLAVKLLRPRDPRRKVLLWATIFALLCGLIDFGSPLEAFLRTLRGNVRNTPASGQIVLVGVDDKTIAAIRTKEHDHQFFANAINAINDAGAERIFIDYNLTSHKGEPGDVALVDSMKRAKGKMWIATQHTYDIVTGVDTYQPPAPEFAKFARLFEIQVDLDFLDFTWNLPFAVNSPDGANPSFAAALARKSGEAGPDFRIDYGISSRSIPKFSAIDVARGGDADKLRGKTVVLAPYSEVLGDIHNIPGVGPMPGAYKQILGAETLMRGPQFDLGWLPAFLFALAILAGSIARKRFAGRLIGLGFVALLFLPILLEANRIFVDVAPGLILLGIFGTWLGWTRAKQRSAHTNDLSGLPNLNALREIEKGTDRPLAVALIRNISEVKSSLPMQLEVEMLAQIAERISLGTAGAQLYQTEEGGFAWLVPPGSEMEIEDQLEGLHAMFVSPVTAGSRQIDLDVSFGLDNDSARSLSNRYGSARLAARDAATEGRKWKRFDSATLDDAEWKLSLLGRLDQAIDNGEIWVAFQPQMTLSTGAIHSAEALVRWTHPERGNISPDEFIAAAEQHNRLDRLTFFVIRESIRSAAQINALGKEFAVSVNVSARLLPNPQLLDVVTSTLKQYKLHPSRLALELTESAELSRDRAAIEPLHVLRNLGVGISIDDYGTGFSTLDYLKQVPATEIKIDRSFVSQLLTSPSDRTMVASTILLAHSLNQAVVAEGIEDRATLAALETLGCDTVQGYLIGRPMALHSLIDFLQLNAERRAA